MGNITDGIPQEIDVGDVVQVDGGPQAGSQGELLRWGVVGGEHDLLPGEAAALGHEQFRQGGTVQAAALFPQDLQQNGVRRGLYRKILPEPRVPPKSLPQPPGILPDAPLVVEVEGGGVALCQGAQPLRRGKGHLRHSRTLLFKQAVPSGQFGYKKLVSFYKISFPPVNMGFSQDGARRGDGLLHRTEKREKFPVSLLKGRDSSAMMCQTLRTGGEGKW